MKKFISGALALLCLFSTISFHPAKAQANETILRVATYNIASKNHPDVQDFVEQFKDYDIDVAGVQEVDVNNDRNDYDMMEAFVCEEYPYVDFGKGRDYAGGDFGVGIVSRYAFVNTQNIPMEGQGESTKAIERVEIEVDGKRVAIYNTHPSWESQALRRRQFRMLIEEVQADPTPYKIITGDFNADQSLYEFTMFLDDFYIANGMNGRWLDTYNADDDPNMKVDMIDNIIVSKNIRIKEVDMVENKLSDHNMLYAELELLGEEAPKGTGNVALGQDVQVAGDDSTDPLRMADHDETSVYALAAGESAQLTLDKSYDLSAVEVLWQQPGSAYQLQASEDGETWETLYEGSASAETDTISLSGQSIRYVRLNARSDMTIRELRTIGVPTPKTIGDDSMIVNGSFEQSEPAPKEQLGPSGTYWDVDLWENDVKPVSWNLQIYDAKGDPKLYQGRLDSEDAVDGTYSVEIRKDDASAHQAFFKQMYQPAKGGVTYTLSFWVKSEDLAEDELQLSVSQRNADQKEIANTNVVYTDILQTQGEWIHYTRELTTHPDTAYMDVVFKIPDHAVGSFHLDAMSIQQIDPVTGVALAGDPTMTIGDTQTLQLDERPSQADPQTYVWTSSDPSIAEVEADGTLHARQAGSVYIQAKAVNNSRLYASIRIDVCADKTALAALLEQTSDLSQGSCTQAVWDRFVECRSQARKVLEDPVADEQMIAQATDALDAAAQTVRTDQARMDLSALCAQADELQEAGYEAESWQAFARAYEHARQMLAREDASAEDLRFAQTALRTAMDQLIPHQEETLPPEDGESGPSIEEEGPADNDAPDTSTGTDAGIWIVMALTGMGLLAMVQKRRPH